MQVIIIGTFLGHPVVGKGESLGFSFTRPKPPYWRQGQAGSWGKDTVRRVHFGVFSTSHFAPTPLSSDWIEPNSRMDVTSPTGGSN